MFKILSLRQQIEAQRFALGFFRAEPSGARSCKALHGKSPKGLPAFELQFGCEGNPGKNGKFTVAAKFNGSASSTENIPSNFTQKDWTYKGNTVSIIYKK